MAGTSKIRWRRDVEALAKERGWTLEPTKAGHLRMQRDGHTVIAPGSPRNPSRSMANMLSLMKRYENDAR